MRQPGQPIINITELRPWWLRFFLLTALASPMFSHLVVHPTIHAAHYAEDSLRVLAYACFVWLFVGLCVGLKQLLDWLAVGAIPAITMLLTGAVFRSERIWKVINHIVPTASADPIQGKLDLIFKLLVIMVSTPLALLFVASFPASSLMRWVSKQGATKTTYVALVAAIFLRMFQHVAEVVERSMDAWKEENPSVYLPRHRRDWSGGVWSKTRVVPWFKTSTTAWCKIITIQTLAAVPNIVRDFGRVLPVTPQSHEVDNGNPHSS